jgi:hypothetical protein
MAIAREYWCHRGGGGRAHSIKLQSMRLPMACLQVLNFGGPQQALTEDTQAEEEREARLQDTCAAQGAGYHYMT